MEKVTVIERAEIIVKLMQDMEIMQCGWCGATRCGKCQMLMAQMARNMVEVKHGISD